MSNINDILSSDIPATPNDDCDINSFEFVVVVEEGAGAEGGTELSNDLKAISAQLQDDLRTNDELNFLDAGFSRLSRVLAGSSSAHPQSSYRQA